MNFTALARRSLPLSRSAGFLAAILSVLGCDLTEGLSENTDVLTDPDPTRVDVPGAQLAAGVHRGLRVFAHHLSVISDSEEPHLLIVNLESREPCDAGPVTEIFDASEFDLDDAALLVVGLVRPATDGERSEVLFVDGDCQILAGPIVADAQYFVAPQYLNREPHRLVLSEGTLYGVYELASSEDVGFQELTTDVVTVEADRTPFAIRENGDLVVLYHSYTNKDWSGEVVATDVLAAQSSAHGKSSVWETGDLLIQTGEGVKLLDSTLVGNSVPVGGSLAGACLGGQFGASVEAPCGSGTFVDSFVGRVPVPTEWAELVLDAYWENSSLDVTDYGSYERTTIAQTIKYFVATEAPEVAKILSVKTQYSFDTPTSSDDPNPAPPEYLVHDETVEEVGTFDRCRLTREFDPHHDGNWVFGEPEETQLLAATALCPRVELTNWQGETCDVYCGDELLATGVVAAPPKCTSSVKNEGLFHEVFNPDLHVPSEGKFGEYYKLMPLVTDVKDGVGTLRVFRREEQRDALGNLLGPPSAWFDAQSESHQAWIPRVVDTPATRGVRAWGARAVFGLESAVAFLDGDGELRVIDLDRDTRVTVHDEVSEFGIGLNPYGLVYLIESGPDQGVWFAPLR